MSEVSRPDAVTGSSGARQTADPCVHFHMHLWILSIP